MRQPVRWAKSSAVKMSWASTKSGRAAFQAGRPSAPVSLTSGRMRQIVSMFSGWTARTTSGKAATARHSAKKKPVSVPSTPM